MSSGSRNPMAIDSWNMTCWLPRLEERVVLLL